VALRGPGRRLAALLLLGGLLCGTACDPRDEVRVTLEPGGRIRIDNHEADMARLPAALKTAGAKTDTRIIVTVPANTPVEGIQELSRTLSAAGYHRFIFAKPKHALAFGE